jgi:hypothetical protein
MSGGDRASPHQVTESRGHGCFVGDFGLWHQDARRRNDDDTRQQAPMSVEEC